VLLLVCALVAAVSVLMLGLVFLWLWVVLRAWLLVERMHHMHH